LSNRRRGALQLKAHTADRRLLDPHTRVQALGGCVQLIDGQCTIELHAGDEQHFLRSELHGEDIVHASYGRIACDDARQLAELAALEPFADLHALNR
jgi:hypothetical protein